MTLKTEIAEGATVPSTTILYAVLPDGQSLARVEGKTHDQCNQFSFNVLKAIATFTNGFIDLSQFSKGVVQTHVLFKR